MFDVPIAIIFFNRPDKLKETFDRVKKIKPKKLFLIQDGPRESRYDSDMEKILECRKVVEDIDWKCSVEKNYSDKNLGCGLRPSSGITWAFTMTNKLIILEDDCVVDLSFFTFCSQMLEKYYDNDKIMLVSGMNLLGKYDSKYSYIFSRVCTIGAWATWKRVWDEYDFEIKSYEDKNNKKILKNNIKFKNVIDQKFWAWNLTREKIKHNEKIDWWDYQFHYLLYLKGGLGIVPTKNLVLNIGYGEGATNVSKKEDGAHFNLKVYSMPKTLKNQKKMECDDIFDKKIYDVQKIKVSKIKIFLSKIKRFILRMKG